MKSAAAPTPGGFFFAILDVRKTVRYNACEVITMESMNITKARQNLYKLVKQTNESHYPVQITGRNGNAVLVSEEDWESIQETLHLYAAPGLVRDIKESMDEPVAEMAEYDPDEEW
jgi:prevent-host-death family protein